MEPVLLRPRLQPLSRHEPKGRQTVSRPANNVDYKLESHLVLGHNFGPASLGYPVCGDDAFEGAAAGVEAGVRKRGSSHGEDEGGRECECGCAWHCVCSGPIDLKAQRHWPDNRSRHDSIGEKIRGLEEVLGAHVAATSDKFEGLERRMDRLLECLQPLLVRPHGEGGGEGLEGVATASLL